jgi:hypothetical protein
VIKWDCTYDKANNIKKASFTVDRSNFNLNEYIQAHNLKKLTSETELRPEWYLNLEKESLTNADLYYKKNPLGGERYDVLLDKKTGRLWVTIKYND